ncbi:MAG: helix-turn-helix domain-containing protein [Clostridia bacterium]
MSINNLTKIRKDKGMTISELAELSGISMGYICHLEKGTRKNPSKETMEKIANVLGKSVTEIFF